MSLDTIIRVNGLGKCYQMFNKPADRMKQAFSFRRKRYSRDFWALSDVSFEVGRGETIGVIGRNGSGKSTLLQIVAGVLTPTCGHADVDGKVSALLELGSGFIPDFTGRENVYTYCTIMGMSRKEIDGRFDDIAAFADIGEFIDQPVKIYSSGMYVRLAFAAAVNVNPDVLIVDEALAVGDARFQHRCMTRINEFRESGVSILFVSHDTGAITRICDRAIVLDQGRIVNQGPSMHIANWYMAFMTCDYDLEKTALMEQDAAEVEVTEDAPLQSPSPEADEAPPVPQDSWKEKMIPVAVDCDADRSEFPPEFTVFRHGDGNARILRAGLFNDKGELVDHFYLGERLYYRFEVEFYHQFDSHVAGVHIRDNRGTDIIAINTFQEQSEVTPVEAGSSVNYVFSVTVDLKPGAYSITNTVAYDQQRMEWMDWVDNVMVFHVLDPQPQRMVFGLYLPSDITFQARLSDDPPKPPDEPSGAHAEAPPEPEDPKA